MKTVFGIGMMMVGVALGAGVTYILMKDKCEADKKENNEAMWAYLNRELAKCKGSSDTTEQDREKQEKVKKRMEKLSTNYNKISEIIKDDPVVALAEKEAPVEHPEDIYEIGFVEFEDGEPMYEKISLTFYQGDTTLADDLDEIAEVSSDILDECIKRFDESEDNVIYFRNCKDECDYEIVRAFGDYKDRIGDI